MEAFQNAEENPPTVTNGVGTAGWRLMEYESAGSTNDLARGLPAWTAVRADRQSSGRGRFGRVFVSDSGGLWISAVLPAEGGPAKWMGFSLMVGLHLVRMLEALGIASARLRWPNDLMCGRKKLAGLLIEQPARDVLVVGFGLNISNSPWTADPELEAISTSIAQVSARVPTVSEMTILTLNALAEAHSHMEEGGMAAAIAGLNSRWRHPTPVKALLADGTCAVGSFIGLNPHGNLRLLDKKESEFLVGHQSIEKLMELD